MSGSGRPNHLLGVQAFRGLAATLVVLYHAGRMLDLPQYAGHIPLDNFFAFGHSGVDFFFVLSGFIITYVHGDDIGRPARLRHYLRRRFSRIYPMYWVITGVTFALALFSADWAARLAPVHVAASTLLVPHGQEPLVGVAWTLEHEMLFYLCFGVAIVRRMAIPVLLVLSIGLVATAQIVHADGLLAFLGDAYHLQFVMGIGAGILIRHAKVPLPRSVAIAGFLSFAVVAAAENGGWIGTAGTVSKLLFGACATAILVGTAAAEAGGLLHFGRASALFGETSYSLYLVHTTVIGLAARGFAALGLFAVLPSVVIFFAVAGLAIAGGTGVYGFIERPLMRRINRRLSGTGSTWQAHPPTALRFAAATGNLPDEPAFRASTPTATNRATPTG